MKLLIAGDFCPHQRVKKFILEDNYSSIFNEVIPIIVDSDYRLLNLECPIFDDSNFVKIKKNGPSLGFVSKTADVIKHIGFDCVTLSNNHFRDYGDMGVGSTLAALDKAGLEHLGGGNNLSDAKKIHYKTINGVMLAFINVCEHEFSIASDSHGGSNPLSPISVYYDIQEAKKKTSNIIVLVHGGHEQYQLPSPRMKELYHFFIDCGARVVINNHQHCYSGYEEYNDGLIFYALGDFCFDYIEQDSISYYGFLLQLEFEEGGKILYKLFPYTECLGSPTIKLLKDEAKVKFKRNISELNSIISSDKQLADHFNHYVRSKAILLRYLMSPYSNRILRKLCALGLLPAFLNEKRMLYLLNYVDCESLRDLFSSLLKNNIYKNGR